MYLVFLGERLIFMYQTSYANLTPVAFVLNSAATYPFFNAPLCLRKPFLAAFSPPKDGDHITTLTPEASRHFNQKNTFCSPRTADNQRFWDWTPSPLLNLPLKVTLFSQRTGILRHLNINRFHLRLKR